MRILESKRISAIIKMKRASDFCDLIFELQMETLRRYEPYCLPLDVYATKEDRYVKVEMRHGG